MASDPNFTDNIKFRLNKETSNSKQFLSLSNASDVVSDHSGRSGRSGSSVRSVRSNYLLTKQTLCKVNKRITIVDDRNKFVNEVLDTFLIKGAETLNDKTYNPQMLLDAVRDTRNCIQVNQDQRTRVLSEILSRTKRAASSLSANKYLITSNSGLDSFESARKRRGLEMARTVALEYFRKYVLKQRVQARIEKRLFDEIKAQSNYCLATDCFLVEPVNFCLQPKIQNAFKAPRGLNESRLSRSKPKVVDCVKKSQTELEETKQKVKEMLQDYNRQQNRLEESHLKMMSKKILTQTPKSSYHGTNQTESEVPFNKSHLYQMLQKEVSQRTENDLRELRQITMEIDFIKNNELNFQPSDLSEMIKTATVIEVPRLTRLCAQGDDADCLYFVIQGHLVATYTLSAQDKRAIVNDNKKIECNPDGLVKAMTTLRAIKEAGEAAIAEQDSSSNQSSLWSRRSLRSRNSLRSKSSKGKLRTFMTQIDAECSDNNLRSIMSVQQPEVLNIVNNYRYLNLMLDTKGEELRQRSREKEPLHVIKNQRYRAIDELVDNYIREVTDRDHYVMQPVAAAERQRQEALQQELDNRNLIHLDKRTSSKAFQRRHSQQNVAVSHLQSNQSSVSQSKQAASHGIPIKSIREASDNAISVSLSSSKRSKTSENERSGADQRKPHIQFGNLDAPMQLVSDKSLSLPEVKEFELPKITSPRESWSCVPDKSVENILKMSMARSRSRSSSASVQIKNSSMDLAVQTKSMQKGGKSFIFKSSEKAKGPSKLIISRNRSSVNVNAGLKTILKSTIIKSPPSDPEIERRSGQRRGSQSLQVMLLGKSKRDLQIDIGSNQDSIESESITDDEMDEKVNHLDNLSMQGIIQEIGSIKKDKNGNYSEVALFNIGKGHFVGAKTMQAAEHDLKKRGARAFSLYARRNPAYVIQFQREKYRKSCENAKNRLKNEKIDFLKSVELFSHFSRNSIKNLVRSLKKETLNRGQYLYEEGKPVDKIFLIINGQFRVTKQVVYLHRERGDEKPMIDDHEQNKTTGKEKTVGKRKGSKRTTSLLEIVVVSSRSIVGDDDAIIESKENVHQTSCQCISLTGEVYELKQEDFLKEFKKVSFWSDIAAQLLSKRDRLVQRVFKKNEVQKSIEHNMMRKAKESQMIKKKQIDQWTDLNYMEKITAEQQMFRNKVKVQMQMKKATSPLSRSPKGKFQSAAVLKTDDQFEMMAGDPLSVRTNAQHPPPKSILKSVEELQNQNKAAMKSTSLRESIQSRKNGRRCVVLMTPSTLTEETAPTCRMHKSQQSHQYMISSQRPQTHSQSLRSHSNRHFLDKASSHSMPQLMERSDVPNESGKALAPLRATEVKSCLNRVGSLPKPSSAGGLLKTPGNFWTQDSQAQTQKFIQGTMFASATPKQSAVQPLRNSLSFSTISGPSQPKRQALTDRASAEPEAVGLNTIVRFLPSDLQMPAGFRRSNRQLMSDFSHERQRLSLGSDLASQQEARHKETFEMMRDQEMVIKQAIALKKKAKMLKLDLKHKVAAANQPSQTIRKTQQLPGQPAETSRANFLIRQSQKLRLGTNDQKGSYGHMIRKKDERVHGISALAKKIDLQGVDQRKNQGGFTFNKHGTTVKGLILSSIPQGQLRVVQQIVAGGPGHARISSSYVPLEVSANQTQGFASRR